MPSSSLLWIANSSVPVAHDWHEALAQFCVKRVSSLPEAYEAVSRSRVDCALVTGELPEVAAIDVLELLHGVDARLPVIFFDTEMSATDAVRLVRAGAYHCLGYRDTLEALCGC